MAIENAVKLYGQPSSSSEAPSASGGGEEVVVEEHDEDEDVLGSMVADSSRTQERSGKSRIIKEEDDSDEDYVDGNDNEDNNKSKKRATKSGKGSGGKKKVATPSEFTYYTDDEEEDGMLASDSDEGASRPRRLLAAKIVKSLDEYDDSSSDEEIIPPFLPLDAPKSELEREREGLFFFQFPTRMPGLAKPSSEEGEKTSDVATDADMDIELLSGVSSDQREASASAAAAAASDKKIAEGGRDGGEKLPYDNHEFGDVSGRIGTINVYENGEAELVLETEDGEEIKYDVSSGIPYTFRRTVCIINDEKSTFEEVGEIFKDIMITPQVES